MMITAHAFDVAASERRLVTKHKYKHINAHRYRYVCMHAFVELFSFVVCVVVVVACSDR